MRNRPCSEITLDIEKKASILLVIIWFLLAFLIIAFLIITFLSLTCCRAAAVGELYRLLFAITRPLHTVTGGVRGSGRALGAKLLLGRSHSRYAKCALEALLEPGGVSKRNPTMTTTDRWCQKAESKTTTSELTKWPGIQGMHVDPAT